MSNIDIETLIAFWIEIRLPGFQSKLSRMIVLLLVWGHPAPSLAEGSLLFYFLCFSFIMAVIFIIILKFVANFNRTNIIGSLHFAAVFSFKH